MRAACRWARPPISAGLPAVTQQLWTRGSESAVKLFEPVRIGSMELKNRLVMAPMTTGYAGADLLPSEQLIAFLETRARGGVGLVTVEACVIDRRHREVPRSMHFSDDAAVDVHRRVVDAVHAHGAKIQPQIVHPGPDALSPFTEKIPSLGPSVIPSYLTGHPSRALEPEELPALLDQYAAAVRRVREAGYDGIELHAAHAYMLLGSFLSPWRNKREDEYRGREREGRLRFLVEVLAAIRKEVGNDFPITLRISGYERVPGGRTSDDTSRIAPRLVEAGVDAFHVSGGHIDRLTSQIVTGPSWGEAHNLGASTAVKNAVDVPVIVVGRIHDPQLAERILQEGRADLIAMGRPLLADPELPRKAAAGRPREIRRCISCENCIDSMEVGAMNCAVNGFSGREAQLVLEPSSEPKRIVVVGGGPGGLEVARLAALRGHRVELHERSRRLGGALQLASLVHPENQPFLDFLIGAVRKLPIQVRLGSELSADAIHALGADAVVIATGGRLVLPDIPGSERRSVWTGVRLRRLGGFLFRVASPAAIRLVSRAWMPLGRRVLIVGADLASLELAEFLAARGRRVTVVEAGDRLAPEIGLKRLTEQMDRLDRLGVALHTGSVVEEILESSAVVLPEGGSTRRIGADSIVLAGEIEADTRLLDALEGRVSEIHAVGDCTGLGLVRKATEEATRVACAL
ncbi:MAG: FAD-dependent oxidoreductase [Deltaproteobacteria bacterium]|nr:FAD-dependent oxidoreductase [Deltaproteobacteria bacterium]